jgi:hypothetical protein
MAERLVTTKRLCEPLEGRSSGAAQCPDDHHRRCRSRGETTGKAFSNGSASALSGSDHGNVTGQTGQRCHEQSFRRANKDVGDICSARLLGGDRSIDRVTKLQRSNEVITGVEHYVFTGANITP